MSTIGEKLHTLRKQNKLTSRQLGAELGVSNSYIIRIEKGKRRPSMDLSIKIAQFFNISLDKLILDDQELND